MKGPGHYVAVCREAMFDCVVHSTLIDITNSDADAAGLQRHSRSEEADGASAYDESGSTRLRLCPVDGMHSH